MKFRQTLTLSLTLAAASLPIHGHDIHELAGIDVEGRGTPLVGEAVSASQGVVGRIDLETRPILRAGEAPEGIFDRHSHRIPPRAFKLHLSLLF